MPSVYCTQINLIDSALLSCTTTMHHVGIKEYDCHDQIGLVARLSSEIIKQKNWQNHW